MPEWFFILVADPWAALYAHGWVFAVFVAFGVLTWGARTTVGGPADSSSPRERSVLIVLTVGAALVVLAQELVRDLAAVLFVNPDWTTNFIWWKYVGPIGILAVSIAVGAVFLRGSRRDVEVRVPPVVARDWATFTSRRSLIFACVALGLLLLTSLVAGLNSSQAVDGHFRLLILSGAEFYGNPAGLQTEGKDYFGWSYSGPTLAFVAAGAVATWWFLRENALRPFRNPETVETETRVRARMSRSALLLFAGTTLLTLAIVIMDMGWAGMPWAGLTLEDGNHVSIGGEFEALSRVLLAVAALLRPVALTLVLLGGTVGWLPALVADRQRRKARSMAVPVAGDNK